MLFQGQRSLVSLLPLSRNLILHSFYHLLKFLLVFVHILLFSSRVLQEFDVVLELLLLLLEIVLLHEYRQVVFKLNQLRLGLPLKRLKIQRL